MLKALFSNRFLSGAVAILILCVGASLLYDQHLKREFDRKVAEATERLERAQAKADDLKQHVAKKDEAVKRERAKLEDIDRRITENSVALRAGRIPSAEIRKLLDKARLDKRHKFLDDAQLYEHELASARTYYTSALIEYTRAYLEWETASLKVGDLEFEKYRLTARKGAETPERVKALTEHLEHERANLEDLNRRVAEKDTVLKREQAIVDDFKRRIAENDAALQAGRITSAESRQFHDNIHYEFHKAFTAQNIAGAEYVQVLNYQLTTKRKVGDLELKILYAVGPERNSKEGLPSLFQKILKRPSD